MSVSIDAPVQYLKGVGPKRARLLEREGIRTAAELLRYIPFRYEDRSRFVRVRDLVPERDALIESTILVAGDYQTSRKRTRIFELIVRDDSGSIAVKFFNQAYLSRVFERGQRVIFYGVPRYDQFTRGLSLINPEFEIAGNDDPGMHTGRIVPVYRRLNQLTTRVIRQIMYSLIENLDPKLPDPIPEALRERFRFPNVLESYRLVHFPECPEEPQREAFLAALAERRTPAHRRFAFEEFFLFQVGLQVTRVRREAGLKPRRISVDDRIRRKLREILPFALTRAQKRVLKEIAQDLTGASLMNRLLQGDVGSGKTIVALLAMLVVVENGFQTAVMAPTELLAEQHLRNVRRLLSSTDYRVEMLTANVKGRERRAVLDAVSAGEVNILIGTHALLEESVSFKNLAFIVIDEQHRFGVIQRSALFEKGGQPDVLVMTATPIPRSLALTVYGDLQVSVLDELPPGRKAVRTVIKTEKSRGEVYRVIRKCLQEGRQVYIVYPLVQESEKSDLKAATEMAGLLSREVFPETRVGLMHGRLKSGEKDELMNRFLSGEVRVLVSTTVIEVGIDVPNASVMVIEHAERFGLSQLHQLRGRIGRGEKPGLCILMVDRVTTREAFERLDIMRSSSDGFKIAEKDLEIRGPGEFLGTRQSGMPEFVFGNILRDRDLLETAREEAIHYSQRLRNGKSWDQGEWAHLMRAWQERFRLFQVG